MFVLFEAASGYSLFEASEFESIGANLTQVQQDILDLSKFGKMVTLKSFMPFKTAAHALDNLNSVSEGIIHPYLKDFLELNMPKSSKKSSVQLGVADKSLASAIKQELHINCLSNESINELTRGLRLHCDKLLRQLNAVDMIRAQLGLAHSYSRAKVQYNVNRSDNMIIQAIALCDQLDKDINLFSMRIREWFSWHFPELAKLVVDHGMYARLCLFIKDRKSLAEGDKLEALAEVTEDTELAQRIIDAAKTSMGTDISDIDMLNIDHFASRLVSLASYRKQLGQYLKDKMHVVAPNLASLIGDAVGARLISHAGSLTNLAKYPASTIQILGAEKALFRALKTRGKTPKYGLIYNSTFIGRAASKNKGRVSRYLANKCSIASRIDSFSEEPTTAFGEALRKQVEERLDFFESGAVPQPNAVVMSSVLKMLSERNKEAAASVAAKGKRVRESSEDENDSRKKHAKKEKLKAVVVDEPLDSGRKEEETRKAAKSKAEDVKSPGKGKKVKEASEGQVKQEEANSKDRKEKKDKKDKKDKKEEKDEKEKKDKKEKKDRENKPSLDAKKSKKVKK